MRPSRQCTLQPGQDLVLLGRRAGNDGDEWGFERGTTRSYTFEIDSDLGELKRVYVRQARPGALHLLRAACACEKMQQCKSDRYEEAFACRQLHRLLYQLCAQPAAAACGAQDCNLGALRPSAAQERLCTQMVPSATETGTGWYLEEIIVSSEGSPRQSFPCNCWLGKSDAGDFDGAPSSAPSRASSSAAACSMRQAILRTGSFLLELCHRAAAPPAASSG